MRPLLPKSHGHRAVETKWQGSEIELAREKPYQGSTTTTQFQRVCEDCNNGWMSRAETQVRPTITPLMKGEDFEFNDEQRDALTRYLVYKILIFDASHRAPVIDPQVARAFYEEQALPEGLKLFLFYCPDGGLRASFRSASVHAHQVGEASERGLPNILTFAWGLGDLLLFAYYSVSTPHPQFAWPERTQLYPENELKSWPPGRPLSRARVEIVAGVGEVLKAGRLPRVLD